MELKHQGKKILLLILSLNQNHPIYNLLLMSVTV
jgi:hypothetical protein